MDHSRSSIWMYREQTECRVQRQDVEGHLAAGFLQGRIPGRTQSEKGKESRRGIAKTRPGKLAKYGITVEQFREAKSDGQRWCIWHKRFESRELFNVGTKQCKDGSRQKDSIKYALYGVADKNHISRQWYPETLLKQGGHCALCEATVGSIRNPRFCYDHDHSCCTGRWSCGKCLRGLICNRCNYRVAQLEQLLADPDWVESATMYINGGKVQ